jgi:hypothetical protein
MNDLRDECGRVGFWLCSALSLSLVLISSAQSMDIEQLQAHFHDREYQLTMTATLNAPLPQIEKVLRDYDAYPQLDARILAARVLNRSTSSQLELFTRINVCFGFICRKVERVEHVDEHPGELLATVIAERSDAERGSTHIQLAALGLRTRVIYNSEIVPKFWVPALVGRPLMLRNLREATVSLFEHIEKRAAATT